MLASRKQEWVFEQEVPAAPSPQSKKRCIAFRVKCFGMIIVLAVAAMFVTVRSEAIIRAGYDLVQMKEQVTKIEKENEMLRLEIAKMKSPQRIQYIATSQLGMVVPQNVYCVATDNKSSSLQTNVKDKTMLSQLLDLVKSSKAEASKGR